jgi:hypothetical protein
MLMRPEDISENVCENKKIYIFSDSRHCKI